MERSWDYLLKTPIGMAIAFVCAILVLVFIVGGGLVMRIEMNKQRIAREKLKEAEEDRLAESG